MSIEEARNIKGGEKVKVNYPPYCINKIGIIPWVDRIYDEEPHAVILDNTMKGCYHLIKIKYIKLL